MMKGGGGRVEDKIDDGHYSLLRLAIKNRAVLLENTGDLWKETEFIIGRDMNP